jgi:hypothetical protein
LQLDPVMMEQSLEELARRDPKPLLVEVNKGHDVARWVVWVVLIAGEASTPAAPRR